MDYEQAKETIDGCKERILEAVRDLDKALAEIKPSKVDKKEHDATIDAVLEIGRNNVETIERAEEYRREVERFCQAVEDALGPIDIDEDLDLHDLRMKLSDLRDEKPFEGESIGPATEADLRIPE